MPNDDAPQGGGPSKLFNPFLAWADLGLRAAEMTLASSQNIGDAVDRITRAGAGVQPEEIIAQPSAPPRPRRAAPPAAFADVTSLQRTMFELFTENWVRWMSAWGTLAALPAGVGLARTVAKRGNPLEAVRSSLRPTVWGEKPATRANTGAMTYPAQRRRADSTTDMQPALASGEGKPRRKAAAKRKGGRRAASK
jgi:hypothetical protein